MRSALQGDRVREPARGADLHAVLKDDDPNGGGNGVVAMGQGIDQRLAQRFGGQLRLALRLQATDLVPLLQVEVEELHGRLENVGQTTLEVFLIQRVYGDVASLDAQGRDMGGRQTTGRGRGRERGLRPG